ncbi:MAG: hypothetical protein FJ293_12680 [Planctomycetes bacterium]|nr:hypothetical protein [Planctomycetota bacterium]
MTEVAPPGRGSARCAAAAGCLAVLFGALLLSFWVATRNFAIADPAQTPATAQVLAMARVEGDQSQEMFSRYFASESNRALFAFLGPFQVALTLLAFLLAFGPTKGGPGSRLLRTLLAVAAVVALLMAPLVPTMIELGRSIDFVPREPVTPERAAFMRWHGLYMLGDIVLLLAALAGVPLLLRRAVPRC